MNIGWITLNHNYYININSLELIMIKMDIVIYIWMESGQYLNEYEWHNYVYDGYCNQNALSGKYVYFII